MAVVERLQTLTFDVRLCSL